MKNWLLVLFLVTFVAFVFAVALEGPSEVVPRYYGKAGVRFE